MALSDVIIIAAALFFFNDFLMNNLLYSFIFLALYNIGLFFIFKTLEVNWDKRMMQKMALNGQVVLANIKHAEILTPIKDSAGRHYNIWKFTVQYWDHQMNAHDGIVFDKLNFYVQTVPLGTVYITHDESKPLKKFILQNIIIGNIPSLIPLVSKYENNKAIKIKYLNVYYNNGLIIETFKQSLQAAQTS